MKEQGRIRKVRKCFNKNMKELKQVRKCFELTKCKRGSEATRAWD